MDQPYFMRYGIFPRSTLRGFKNQCFGGKSTRKWSVNNTVLVLQRNLYIWLCCCRKKRVLVPNLKEIIPKLRPPERGVFLTKRDLVIRFDANIM